MTSDYRAPAMIVHPRGEIIGPRDSPPQSCESYDSQVGFIGDDGVTDGEDTGDEQEDGEQDIEKDSSEFETESNAESESNDSSSGNRQTLESKFPSTSREKEVVSGIKLPLASSRSAVPKTRIRSTTSKDSSSDSYDRLLVSILKKPRLEAVTKEILDSDDEVIVLEPKKIDTWKLIISKEKLLDSEDDVISDRSMCQ